MKNQINEKALKKKKKMAQCHKKKTVNQGTQKEKGAFVLFCFSTENSIYRPWDCEKNGAKKD